MPTPPPATEPRSDALPPGTRLAEFELRQVLGSGGFGIVYRAWDAALEREVAIKEYMPATLAGRVAGGRVSVRSAAEADTFAVGLRSFVNEARLLARFDHPSLVKVHRFWEAAGTAYMVMPLYRGITLREMRRQLGRGPDEAACRRLLVPLLSALELLHSEGVYHRDIAPDNILVGDDGLPVLLDFGAARQVLADHTRQLTAILKPNFSPLEQYANESSLRQGPWTDLYGLAATMYFLLAGHAPVPATARALHDELRPLAQIKPPGCSAGFLQALDWGLALRPAERPQSAAMWSEALDGRMAVPHNAWYDTTQPGIAPRPQLQIDFDPTQPWSTDTPVLQLPEPVPQTLPEAAPPTRSLPASVAQPSKAPMRVLAGVALLLVAALGWLGWRTPPAPERAAFPGAAAVPPAAVLVAASAPTPVLSLAAHASAPAPTASATRSTKPPVRAASAVPSAATTQTTSRVVGPKEACGRRVFIAQLMCMRRECERPALRTHPECERMRRDEEAHEASLRQ
jgi:serine/threonine protein kinase